MWRCGEGWLCLVRSVYWARIFRVTHDRSQSIGCSFQIAWLRWRSERRNISSRPSQNRGHSRLMGIAKHQNVQLFGYVHVCTAKIVYFSLSKCGRNKNRGKERKEEKPEVLCGESWKTLTLKNLTPPLDQVFLGCAERVCKTNKRIVRKNRKLFESLISADTAKPLPDWEPSLSDTVSSSYDMEGHSKKCVERKYDLSNKKIANYSKFAPPCLDDHQL